MNSPFLRNIFGRSTRFVFFPLLKMIYSKTMRNEMREIQRILFSQNVYGSCQEGDKDEEQIENLATNRKRSRSDLLESLDVRKNNSGKSAAWSAVPNAPLNVLNLI